jgi:hypothetical protein
VMKRPRPSWYTTSRYLSTFAETGGCSRGFNAFGSNDGGDDDDGMMNDKAKNRDRV